MLETLREHIKGITPLALGNGEGAREKGSGSESERAG